LREVRHAFLDAVLEVAKTELFWIPQHDAAFKLESYLASLSQKGELSERAKAWVIILLSHEIPSAIAWASIAEAATALPSAVRAFADLLGLLEKSERDTIFGDSKSKSVEQTLEILKISNDQETKSRLWGALLDSSLEETREVVLDDLGRHIDAGFTPSIITTSKILNHLIHAQVWKPGYASLVKLAKGAPFFTLDKKYGDAGLLYYAKSLIVRWRDGELELDQIAAMMPRTPPKILRSDWDELFDSFEEFAEASGAENVLLSLIRKLRRRKKKATEG
jgi:hypothetical protein